MRIRGTVSGAHRELLSDLCDMDASLVSGRIRALASAGLSASRGGLLSSVGQPPIKGQVALISYDVRVTPAHKELSLELSDTSARHRADRLCYLAWLGSLMLSESVGERVAISSTHETLPLEQEQVPAEKPVDVRRSASAGASALSATVRNLSF